MLKYTCMLPTVLDRSTYKIIAEILYMKKLSILAATLAILIPMAANADAPSYNLVYAGYAKGSVDGYSGGKGYAFGGSDEFYPNWYFAFDYNHNSYDGGYQTGGFFTADYTISLGAHMSLTDSMDLFGQVSYANDHWKQGPSTNLFPGFTVSTSETKSGYDLRLGIRAMVSDNWELDAYLGHNDVGLLSHDHNNSENVGSVGAVYNITDQLAMGLNYARSSQASSSLWMLTARWYFQEIF